MRRGRRDYLTGFQAQNVVPKVASLRANYLNQATISIK